MNLSNVFPDQATATSLPHDRPLEVLFSSPRNNGCYMKCSDKLKAPVHSCRFPRLKVELCILSIDGPGLTQLSIDDPGLTQLPRLS